MGVLTSNSKLRCKSMFLLHYMFIRFAKISQNFWTLPSFTTLFRKINSPQNIGIYITCSQDWLFVFLCKNCGRFCLLARVTLENPRGLFVDCRAKLYSAPESCVSGHSENVAAQFCSTFRQGPKMCYKSIILFIILLFYFYLS